MSEKIGNLTIWFNVHKKEKEQPDYRGKMDVEIDGQVNTVEISLWIDRYLQMFPIKLSGQITKGDY